jgi:hypothetical protein
MRPRFSEKEDRECPDQPRLPRMSSRSAEWRTLDSSAAETRSEAEEHSLAS